MTFRMRVMKHEADDEKDKYVVTLMGSAADLVSGQLLDVTLKLKAKAEDIIQKFPRGACFQVKIENEKEE